MGSYELIIREIYFYQVEEGEEWVDLSAVLQFYPNVDEQLVKRLEKDKYVEILDHEDKQQHGILNIDALYGRLTRKGIDRVEKGPKKLNKGEKLAFGLLMTFVFFLIGKMLSKNEERERIEQFRMSPFYNQNHELNKEGISIDSKRIILDNFIKSRNYDQDTIR